MTVVEFLVETRYVTKETWWDVLGVVVAAILTVLWLTGSGNSAYLLYAGLLFLIGHAYVSIEVFDTARRRVAQADQTVVAYRELVESHRWNPSGEKHDEHTPAWFDEDSYRQWHQDRITA
jgi:hypothetical protein